MLSPRIPADNNAPRSGSFLLCSISSKAYASRIVNNVKGLLIQGLMDRIVIYSQERLMTGKVIGLIVAIQIFLMNSTAWADSDELRPEILDIREEWSPGAIIVIVLSLVIIGFGIGFLVGRHSSRTVKRS